MKIPRCRYWRCPECRALAEKKGLADLLRRHRAGDDLDLTGKFRCPRCRSAVRAIDLFAGEYDVPEDEWDSLPGPAELVTKPEVAITHAPDDDAAEWAVREEPDPDEEEEYDRRKRRHLTRYRGLMTVNVGLAIHYFGMLAFLLGVIVGWMAFVVLVATVVTAGAAEDPEAAARSGFILADLMFWVSWGLTTASSVTEMVGSAFCLGVPHGLARQFLAGSIAVRSIGLAFGVVFLLFRLPGIADLVTLFFTLVGWLLWIGFLWALADCLRYPTLGKEAIAVTWGALFLVINWILATTFALVYLIISLMLAQIGGFFPCFMPLAVAASIAGIIRYLLASGTFDTLWSVLLYPTGIPLVMRYLDLIATTRMIILRRS